MTVLRRTSDSEPTGRELDALVERLSVRLGRDHEVVATFKAATEALLAIWRAAGLLRLEPEPDGERECAGSSRSTTSPRSDRRRPRGLPKSDAELIRIDQIDPRLPDQADRKLLLALHHHKRPWDGLITTDSSMLNQAQELAALLESKLTLVVATESGHDSVRARFS